MSAEPNSTTSGLLNRILPEPDEQRPTDTDSYREAVTEYREAEDRNFDIAAHPDEESPVAEESVYHDYERVRAVRGYSDNMVKVMVGAELPGMSGPKLVPRKVMHAYTGEEELADMAGYVVPVQESIVGGEDSRVVLSRQMKLELGHTFEPETEEEDGLLSRFRRLCGSAVSLVN